MNITTIIELNNQEVEQMVGARMVFVQEQITEQIIHTCVDCFSVEGSEDKIEPEHAMEKVFEQLKGDGLIPEGVTEFSFEMPACGTIKKHNKVIAEIPQNVVLTFTI
jgi:hypothetical protein